MKTSVMKSSVSIIALVTTCVLGCATRPLDPSARPTPPPDQPFSLHDTESLEHLFSLMVPYTEQARATYPEAKRRFIEGLPPNHMFSVTTRLVDDEGRFEQVFIDVQRIEKGTIIGLIANEINVVSGYKTWQEYTFPETDLVDWTIVRPDGTEEGNYVGKFLDQWQASQE